MNAILQAFLDAMVNDDGSGTTGDLMDKTWWTDLIGRIDTVISLAGLSLEQANIFYVATTGDDDTGDGSLTQPWATVGHALEVLRPYRIAPGGSVTLQIQDGTYALTAPIANVPDGILIKGQSRLIKAITSVQSRSVGGGYYNTIVNMTDVSGISINDECVISNASGGTNPTALTGSFNVSNVDAVNSRITLQMYYADPAPSGAIVATATIYKTRLSFTGESGITADTNCSLQDLALKGDKTTVTAYGVHPQGATTSLTNVAIREFGGGGIRCEQAARVIADNVCLCTNKGTGIYASTAGYVEATNTIICDNTDISGAYGIAAYNAATVIAPEVSLYANTSGVYCEYSAVVQIPSASIVASGGVEAQFGGQIKIRFASVSGATGYGVYCGYHALVDLFQTTISNCGSYQIYVENHGTIQGYGATLSGTSAAYAGRYGFASLIDASITGTVSPALNTQGNVYGYLHKP